MKKLLISLAAPVAVLAASPAYADAITLTPASVGTSFTLDYNGYTGAGTIGGLTGQTVLTLTGIDGNNYVFSYQVTNNSSTPITNSRISGFGFNTNPDITGATSTGTYAVTATDANVPNVGTVDVCFKDGGGTNSCAGGGGGGVSIGDNGAGTLTLSFANAVSSLTLSDFFVRYQSIAGAGRVTSAVGSGTLTTTPPPPTPVPAPGMALLFALGAGGLMLARRRKVQATPNVKVAFA